MKKLSRYAFSLLLGLFSAASFAQEKTPAPTPRTNSRRTSDKYSGHKCKCGQYQYRNRC